jgi:putative membrane protein
VPETPPLLKYPVSDLNDPRVLFAAERTLLAWNRTSLALMAFGFVIERFGLFLRMFGNVPEAPSGRVSFWIGVAFIVLGSAVAIASSLQYLTVLRGLRPVEIPGGYRVNLGVWLNFAVAAIGIALTAYLLFGSGA